MGFRGLQGGLVERAAATLYRAERGAPSERAQAVFACHLMHLGLAEAERARDAILAALTVSDSPIALAIADAHGMPILLMRQDAAPPRMLSRARSKAYTAAVLGLDTVTFRDAHLKAKGRTLNDWGDPQLTSLQGGLTIKLEGQVAGGIAMSGNSTLRDEALARIGLDALRGLR